MLCNIKWNTLNSNEKALFFRTLTNANILQSSDYAEAICKINHQKMRQGVIYIDGNPAGYVQILEAGLLKNLIHGVILDRGPLWLEDYGTAAHFKAFCECFNREFPKRWGRRRRFIPEIETSPAVLEILNEAGFHQNNKVELYQTNFLDLTSNQEALYSHLKKNWRGSLKKAKESHLTCQWDCDLSAIRWFIEYYAQNKQQKGYADPSPRLLWELCKVFEKKKHAIVGKASHNDTVVAAVLILCHGRGATYQAGWTTDLGKKKSAHHFLLWDAIERLQAKDIGHFDLGGFDEQETPGIAKFKKGMGGQIITLPGMFH